MLNWGLQRGHIIIPRSSDFNRCVENFNTTTFKIETADVDQITEMDEGFRIAFAYPFTLN